MKIKKIQPDYFRNIIFGAEDSLVSTGGVLFGIAATDVSLKTIILTGLIIIFVEALSMGAGAYLSESSIHEIKVENGEKQHKDSPLLGGIIMFLSYFVAGFIPLLPYILVNSSYAKYVSLTLILVALFIIGYIPSKKLTKAFRMVFVAGIAAIIGLIVGNVANIYIL